jgi:hypothetical protein
LTAFIEINVLIVLWWKRIGCQNIKMSFLDNLEDNLKAFESRDQDGLDESRRRERDREDTVAAAPWAERLKREPFAGTLMQQATLEWRPRRIKVHLMWIGTTLRLEARGHRLELRPGPKGIAAVFLRGADQIGQEPVDLAGNPKELTARWMVLLDEQKRLDDERAALELPDDE